MWSISERSGVLARIPLLLAISACASGPVTKPDRFYENCLRDAAREYERGLQTGADKDRTVFLLESGLTHLTAGDLATASTRLREASSRMGLLYGDGQDGALTLWGTESDKEFKGEPYEQSLCCFYQGLILLMKGDFEHAKTAFLAAELNDRSQGMRSDFALPIFFEALARLRLGDRDQALERLAWLERLRPELAPLLETARNGRWNAVIVADAGLGPAKVQSGSHGASLGFRQDWCAMQKLRARCGVAEVDLYRLAWTFHQAAESGARVVDTLNRREGEWEDRQVGVGSELLRNSAEIFNHIDKLQHTADELSRTTGQDVRVLGIGDQRRAGMYVAGVAGLFFIAAMITRTGADVRGWTTLPDSIYVGLAQLPPGDMTLELQCYDVDDTRLGHTQSWQDVPVASDFNVYHLRLMPSRTGGAWQTDRWGKVERSESGR